MDANDQPPSTYELPRESAYLRNLSALWTVDPATARRIEAEPADPEVLRIEPSRSGLPTAAVCDGERWIYLHSRHDPAAEAAQIAQVPEGDESLVVYVLGLGLGHHVRRILASLPVEAVVVAIEPSVAMARAALEQLDLGEAIRTGRLRILPDPTKPSLLLQLEPLTTLVHAGSRVVVHPATSRLAERWVREVRQWILEFESLCRTAIQTLLINGRRTAENITRNIGWYAASAGIDDLRGRYAGVPAVIVSAGPSLRKNRHLLPEAAGKAVVIATQTTLKPLLDQGVEPHFVTSLDYHDICTRFFEDLPARLRTQLVAEAKATPRVFGLHPGGVRLVGNELAEKLLRRPEMSKAKLPAGATVAHLSFYLAEYLGCDPIIFVGQDLGFGDHLSYVPGTGHDDVARPEIGRFYTPEMKQWDTIVRERRILRAVPDIHGRPIYTEQRLFAYLQQFERDFARSRARIIDASEGGAMKRGAQVMTLREAMDRFGAAVPPDYVGGDALPRWDRLDLAVRELRLRLDEVGQVREIAAEVLPLLELAEASIEDARRTTEIIAQLDPMRQRMNRLGVSYDLVTQLSQATEMKRFEADLRLAASGAGGVERQRRQVRRDLAHTRSIIDAADSMKRLLAETINRLEEQSSRTSREAA